LMIFLLRRKHQEFLKLKFMKKNQLLFILSIFSSLFNTLNAQRQLVSLNKEWDFNGASLWEESIEEVVDLPHTWNTEDAAQGYTYFRGEGNYTKKYFVDQSLKGKRLFLKFEGVQTVANVSVNGTHLGEHRGGYSAFTFEITKNVKYGEYNYIEVKVDNSETEDILPLGGDFNIYGGIYRPVQLIITEEICISPLDFASPGVYLFQNNITKEKAEVSVVTKISNASVSNSKIELEVVISDAVGKIVHQGKKEVFVNAGGTKDTNHSVLISKPHLWNGLKDPYLYSIKVLLKEGEKIIDEITQPLGLRYYHTDAEKGFFLNGEHLKIKGVSRHQDFAGVGSALSEKHHRQDMKFISEMGANGIRLAHYQHSEFFYALSDSLGMTVWAEIPFVGSNQDGYIDSDEFRKNSKQQLQELIRQNFNHPSILFWGIYNEIGNYNDPVLTAIINDLQKLAKAEDPTRQTVAASFIRRVDDSLHKIPDMIAWNRYFGWYYNKPFKLGDFLDLIHEEEPSFKIGVSEYGAGGSVMHHEEKIRRPFPIFHEWHPEEYQTTVHEGIWKVINDRDYVWGSYIWNMFDFGSHFRREGDAIGINDKGMVSYDRNTKKDAFFFYKANWSEEPVIHLTNTRFKIRENDKINVKVYSNLGAVELFVNGKSAGTKKGENAVLIWQDIHLKEGNNKVKAVANINGKKYSDTVIWMYEKNLILESVISFFRWLIKPFIVLLISIVFWMIRLLVKKQVRSRQKVFAIVALVLAILFLLAILIGQILVSGLGFNLFEYSLI
jgi:beta-galactosidase